MDYRDRLMFWIVVIAFIAIVVGSVKAAGEPSIDCLTDSGRPVLYVDTDTGAKVVQVVTNGVSGFGWCAPTVLEGEPVLTEYGIWLNGEEHGRVEATGQGTPEQGWQETVNFNTDAFIRGITNIVWVVAYNETGAVSSKSDALGIVYTEPRRPMNLQIVRTAEATVVGLNNIPPDVRDVSVQFTDNLLAAFQDGAVVHLRGQYDR